jgi:ABC-type spermidine/putrescine transport system permease subunit I
MAVTVTLVTAFFGVAYFRHVHRAWCREGLLLGVLWMFISLLIDAPLMLVGGPVKMAPAAFAGDMGLTYLIMPIITMAISRALEKAQRDLHGPVASS